MALAKEMLDFCLYYMASSPAQRHAMGIVGYGPQVIQLMLDQLSRPKGDAERRIESNAGMYVTTRIHDIPMLLIFANSAGKWMVEAAHLRMVAGWQGQGIPLCGAMVALATQNHFQLVLPRDVCVLASDSDVEGAFDGRCIGELIPAGLVTTHAHLFEEVDREALFAAFAVSDGGCGVRSAAARASLLD
jgi:hypothetical protein